MKKGSTAAVLLTLGLLCSCSADSGSVSHTDSMESESRDVFAMDTYMNLKAYGENAGGALSAAQERILELEAELSVTDENSDIYRLNSSAGERVQVSEDTARVLSAAVRYGELTGGMLDITLYPVLRAWGFTTQEYRIPGGDELSELLKNVDYSRVDADGVSAAIPEDFMVDLGSVAKGYTSDAVMETMRENRVDSAIISLGGNVQALGSKPDGSPWRVAVRDPFYPDSDMCVLEIEDCAVITSGNYERYFVGGDGNTYWHIIDPADGYPADNGVVSATIVGKSGLMCDALSTAMFVAGEDRAAEFWKSSIDDPELDFEMILVTDDGRILYTEGLEDGFTSAGTMPAEVIERG